MIFLLILNLFENKLNVNENFDKIDVYTIVIWNQRNCGKSYSKEQNDVALTKDMLLTDGKEVTE